MTCNDLRLGGTLSATGISGGTSINSTALLVSDWSRLLGAAGISGGVQVVNGRPGGYLAGDLLGRERYPTLNMEISKYGPNLALVQPTFDEQKQANTDTFLGLLTDPGGNYLEVDMPDGSSRFLYVYSLEAAPILQARTRRTISAPLVSTYPYWREGGNQASNVVSGADTITNGGNREIHDAILVFAGDGTFTHSGLGWAIEVTGSGAAVTVDLGARTVVESGSPATNRIRRTAATNGSRSWGWFDPGSNSVTADVSVTVTYRNAWA